MFPVEKQFSGRRIILSVDDELRREEENSELFHRESRDTEVTGTMTQCSIDYPCITETYI
jgi:hypothetical protein